MTKKKKIIISVSSVTAGLLLSVLLGLILTGYLIGWGIFSPLYDIKMGKLAGNSDEYALEKVEVIENSPLSGKNILYLGSSVTYGASSMRVSFVEYIAKRNNTTYVKEAVNGTTLVENGNSYVRRLKKIDKTQHFDLFVCQLSTNDSSQNKPLGKISEDDNYDTSTVCGAIEFIITYVRQTWNCPVVFYTGSYYESENYSAMVSALKQIQEKHGMFVADLYSDKEFNDISSELYNLYMADQVHPTRAGYLKWWTPKIEETLYEAVG